MIGVKKMLTKIKNNKLALGLLISLLCLTIIGVSYAVWRISLQQTESNRISTACFDITFKEDSEAIQLEKAYPILDEEGMTGTPYIFTLTNNCDGYASYQINLEVLNETTLDSKYIKVYLDNSSPSILSDLQVTSTTLDEATTAYILNTGYFEPSESKTFNLRIWMDEDTPALEETMNKTFASKVTVTTSYLKTKPSDYEICVSKYGEDSIQCSILANVDETGKCPTVNEDGTVVVNSTEKTDGYVCSAPDDYGTSYYFRGNVENNWVKFANSYWRIIRINGDSTIRMIYAGDASVIDALENKEEVLKNGYNDGSTDYTQIGTRAFNSSWDNTFVGYMYGNREEIVEGYYTYPTSHSATATIYYAQEYTYNAETDRFTLKDPVSLLGTEVTEDYVGWYTMGSGSSATSYPYVYKITSVTPSDGSSSAIMKYHYVAYGTTSKEKAQENVNDSTIKEAIDSWYESHIKDTEYETYIADTLFCNDRSFNESNTGTGFGLSRTTYRANSGNKTLKCSQKNDRFTVDDEEIGNGALTYPISLITIDEAYLAGGYDSTNSSYYLYTGNYYWTLSPSRSDGTSAYVRIVFDDGGTGGYDVGSSRGVRPVLNLKAGSLKTGLGTALDPYRVE